MKKVIILIALIAVVSFAETIRVNGKSYRINRGSVYSNGQRVGSVRTSSTGTTVVINGKSFKL